MSALLGGRVAAQAPNEGVVYLDSLRQTVRGFGAANIVGWNPGLNYGDMTSAQIQTAFGSGPGQLGFTIMRLRIPPDSSQFRINVASAKLAQSLGAKVIATPWTPPAWMKTNKNIVSGGLDTNNYAAFAKYLKSFADTMANNGAPLYAVSVQNEPDFNASYEGCLWSGTQFLQFMKNNAPAVGIPVFMPEAASYSRTLSDPTLNDSLAASHAAFVGGHIYGATPSSYPLALSKGKELWMTEYLINSPGSGADMDISLKGAMATAKSIHDCMTADMSAYVWWYLVRYYGPMSDGTIGGAAGTITKKGYVMSQFARFARPGYARVLSAVPRGNIYLSAYKSGSKVVVVALNLSATPADQPIRLQGIPGTITAMTPYVTSGTKNCEQGTSITVSGGVFTPTLADSSITTFVGDVVTGVEDGSALPQAFELFQNYPNPFNPSTEIRYELPLRARVTLRVFNMLGQEVATLVNGLEDAGLKSLTFDARDLPSGVYVYRLQANEFVQTKKLLILK
jgi:glucuronoarabinoxylan endo-1,4-beta-xylanase